MGALNVPPTVTVQFDDGSSVELQLKSRDAAVAERDLGHDFSKTTYIRSLYAMTLAALMREKRTNGTGLPRIPDTIDGLIDIADVIPEEDAGKDSDPAPSPG